MQEQIVHILFSLLRLEICQITPPEDIKAQLSTEVLTSLYSLSKKHDISHLIADALEKTEYSANIGEIGAKFQKQHMMAIYRYQQTEYEFNRLCKLLEEKQIPFLPLKGSVIRNDYPEPWMRTSCDIDILVHEKDLEVASEYLINDLGYKLQGKCAHDISLFSPSGIHLELHYSLVEDCYAKNASLVLSSVWEQTKIKDGYAAYREMSEELFYFYHIAHMAKHFEEGGCGIRPFIDLWILDHLKKADLPKCDILLEKGGLLKFAQASRTLADIWFSEEPTAPVFLQMQEYILYGGMYGTLENRVTLKQTQTGGKFKFILSRIFVPYNQLKCVFPILNKHRWLTPLFEVVRWFKILFSGRTKKSMQEFSLNQNVSQERTDATAQLLSKLGL